MTQLIWPRRDRYNDWGGKRRVLVFASATGYALFIAEGHYASHGVPGFGRVYQKASLILKGPPIYPNDSHWYDTIAEGRISRATIREHPLKIDLVFGEGTAQKIVPSATLYLP